ncbi:MAG TPA: hypothetical protein VL461_14890 [Dictyobacter sp.]|nr:hypothetical protein [Dictyobacter sp.]
MSHTISPSSFFVPTAFAKPEAIISGPDRVLWFTEQMGDKIGCISLTGKISEYRLPSRNGAPLSVSGDQRRGVWLTEPGSGKIAHVLYR